jgi:hypothetical protein
MPRFQQIEDPSDNPELVDLYREIVENGFGKGIPLIIQKNLRSRRGRW